MVLCRCCHWYRRAIVVMRFMRLSNDDGVLHLGASDERWQPAEVRQDVFDEGRPDMCCIMRERRAD
jgi:hypothetical protein